jgi:hypothetical protein
VTIPQEGGWPTELRVSARPQNLLTIWFSIKAGLYDLKREILRLRLIKLRSKNALQSVALQAIDSWASNHFAGNQLTGLL